MALDTAEAIQAAFAALPIGQKILEDVKALPPKEERKAVDYAPLLGLDPDGSVYKILALVDQVDEDVQD